MLANPGTQFKKGKIMNRNLKALGLALVAVFVMSAMVAAGAHAEKAAKFTFGAGTTKLITVADGNQTYTLGIRNFICTTVDGTAAVSGSEASEVTSNTDINYTNCHTTALGLNFPTTITQEANCHYTFTAGTYTKATNDAHGSVHICGATIDIYTNHADHTAGKLRCQMHIPAQTVTGLTYTNTTTEGKMAATIDVNAATTATVTTGVGHPVGCSAHEHANATYKGNIWVKGTDSIVKYTDVTVS